MRYDVSGWKARRWIAAAHALERLPRTADALVWGELGIDKVVELARFAKPGDETGLLRWARTVSARAIRRRGDLAARDAEEDGATAVAERRLAWWITDDGRFALEGELPSAQGSVVARALDRMAERVPSMPGEEGPGGIDARRADALWGSVFGARR